MRGARLASGLDDRHLHTVTDLNGILRLGKLEAGSAEELIELEGRFVIEFLGSGEHVMSFPIEASSAVAVRAMEDALVSLLKWQKDAMGGYDVSGDLFKAPSDDATDEDLRRFVVAFMGRR